ncbi:37s ribosomal protein mitochondrial [Ophiocordyceps camponoti-floridani]|uniref:37s ribosomal protein mitochondrial n=1 Tax=Ophiocordyceps camponoti-floridani TaxID=2030778 RepID=A0A8H4VE12_9HYPO|nr:37s ribosomal protein mitochondrial [Ophiocordyceps camponoti-floridani]
MIPRGPSASPARLLADAALPRLQWLPQQRKPLDRRPLSTTPHLLRMTRLRHQFITWLQSGEANSYRTSKNRVRYVKDSADKPFPNNPLFRSQPVLSNDTRERIWHKVVVLGHPLKGVSSELNVDVRRVAAVVRLKQLEKQMAEQGKKLATPYAEAVLAMLPKAILRDDRENEPFEPINDVHIHKRSMHQLFLPVSESRYFTREDAAEAFGSGLLSVDKRCPQPHLIDMEREILSGKGKAESKKVFGRRVMEEEQKFAQQAEKDREKVERHTFRIKDGRFEYRFSEANVNEGGGTGRSRKDVGWRYGAPHQDRKRGLVKIPKTIPAEPWNLLSRA